MTPPRVTEVTRDHAEISWTLRKLLSLKVFRNISDIPEFEQLTVIKFIYEVLVLTIAWDPRIIPVIVLYNTYVFTAIIWAAVEGGTNEWRRYFSMPFDALCTFWIIWLNGPHSTWLTAIPVLTAIGHAHRYGLPQMWTCAVLNYIGYASLYFYHPWWSQHRDLCVAVSLPLVASPFYIQKFVRQNRSLQRQWLTALDNQSQLISSVSHNVKTPLTAILSAARILKSRAPSQATTDLFTDIERCATVLLNQMSGMLRLSITKAGLFRSSLDTFSLKDLIARVFSSLELNARLKQLDVNLEETADIPDVVFGDEETLQEILICLTSNAVKFTDRGSITLRITPMSGHLRFDVTDTGPGLSSDDQTFLFTHPLARPYQRPSKETGRTGLGLAIAHASAQAVGAELKVESRLGHGSTFSLIFPLEPVSHSHVPPLNRSSPIRSKTILLVEDQKSVAAYYEEFLSAQGHGVTVFHDGLSGLAALQSKTYDIAIIDLNLPSIDGIEIIRRIRAQYVQEDRPYPTFIIYSADESESSRNVALAAGAHFYLTKPISESLLLRIVDSHSPMPNMLEHGDASATSPLSLPRIEQVLQTLGTPEKVSDFLSHLKRDLASFSRDIRTAANPSDLSSKKDDFHRFLGIAKLIGAGPLTKSILAASAKKYQSLTLTEIDSIKKNISDLERALDTLTSQSD